MTRVRGSWPLLIPLCVGLHACAAPSGPQPLWLPTDAIAPTCDWREPGCAPTKEQALKAMADITPAVKSCLRISGGALTVCMEFASDGTVRAAGKNSKTGCIPFATGPLADPAEKCVKSALFGAKLPPFRSQRFRMSYPFKAGA